MAQLTNEEVLELSKLAKIALSADEVAGFKSDLEEILNFVEKLNDLDTTGLKPTHQVTGLTNVMRKDVIKDYGIDKQAIMDNTPANDGKHIKVRKVL